MELLVGILFGMAGSAYVVYGKSDGEAWFLLAGFALMAFPYLVSGMPATLLVGTLLLLTPVARAGEWF